MTGDLEESRGRVERGVADLRTALAAEFGSAPRLGRWALVLLAAAAGFALGSAAGARRAGRRLRRPAVA